MNTNQEAPILKLPVEVLHLILEFIPDYVRVRYEDESGQPHDHAQLLVIRQVCRLFRNISHNLSTWQDDRFDFSFLLPYDDDDEQSAAFREGKLLRALFNDEHFVVRLNKKRNWKFSTLESVFAVLHSVPMFPHNASKLYLELFDESEIALKRLSICQQVVDISLHSYFQIIDLDVLASFFPALQRLTLSELDEFAGSLNNLSVLQSLEMDLEFSTSAFDRSLIPVKSAATLTSLTIRSDYSFSSVEYDFNPLDILYNLSNLSLRPLDSNFGAFIINTSTRLASLTIALSDEIPSLTLIRDVFSSRCLSRLKSFKFIVPGHLLLIANERKVLEFGTPIIDAITSCLFSLQTLTLAMGLYLGWCHYFSRLKNLKSMTWTVSGKNYAVFEEVVGADVIAVDLDPITITEGAFERVFADFREKPELSIKFT